MDLNCKPISRFYRSQLAVALPNCLQFASEAPLLSAPVLLRRHVQLAVKQNTDLNLQVVID